MRLWSIGLLALLKGQAGCESGQPGTFSSSDAAGAPEQPSDAGPIVKHGAGTIVYPNSDLRSIKLSPSSDSPAFAASILGLSTVEVIHHEQGKFEATPIDAPELENPKCQARASSAIAVGDIDLDGIDDVLVFDTCGNWIALGTPSGEFRSTVWANVLPDLPSFPFLDLVSWSEASPEKIIVGAFGGAIALLRLKAPEDTWHGPESASLPVPYFVGRTTQLFAKLSQPDVAEGHSLLVQSSERMLALSVEDLDGGVGIGLPSILRQVVQAPYLAPFEGFDHLSTILLAGCPAIALGIGMFSRFAGMVPRKLQMITFQGAQYSPADVASGYDAVTTVVVIVRESEGDAMVGIYGTSGGQSMFALWQLSGCQQIAKVAEAPIEFDRRIVEAPGFGDPPIVPKTDGVKIVTAQVGQELWFMHYDGWDVRLIRAAPSPSGWSITEERDNVHRDRADLSFGTPP